MKLNPNDVIPVSIGKGCIGFLVTANGLNFIPKDAELLPSYSDLRAIRVYVNSPANISALRLLGVDSESIRKAQKLGESGPPTSDYL